MCGIAGIVNYRVHAENLAPRARVLCDKLYHRGPDEQNIIAFPNIIMVHTRLALLDLARGQQPYVSTDQRYIISYNGEVYNYRELRKQLEKNWLFKTDSDTEVILAAYAHWGERCLNYFNGMFAFFIWDSVKNEGFAARDLLGIKPFVYQYKSGEFIFSSEAKAIVAIQSSSPMVNRSAIIEYIAAPYFSGVETSLFEGLEYLQPGHSLKISKQGIYSTQWGDYELSASLTDNKKTTEAMSELLLNAVQQAMISDAPVGTYLSGGFDSTLITAIAHKHAEKKLGVFTIKFTDQDKFDYNNSLIVTSDDTPYAISAAKQIGVKQRIISVNRSEVMDTIKKISCTNDALPVWEQEIAQHHLARIAALDYKAILTGDAADETHYGYPFLLDEQVTASPSAILQRFSVPPLKPELKNNLLAFFDDKYKTLTKAAGHSWTTPLDRHLATTYLIVKRWLPRLLHNGDVHAMQHSLEARVPFADINLLNMAKRVHPASGYRNGTEKWLLRQSAKGLLPESSRLRKKSALPKDQGAGKLYKASAATLFKSHKVFLENFFDMKQMQMLCRSDTLLSEQQRALLFRTISLCHWCDYYGVNIR
ncbi:MAG: asparagine synthase (glutamine-hydrolyzing) [Pseudomonadota bacterium]